MSYHFLMDLALILLSTKILGLAAQKFQMPQVVGALIAGLTASGCNVVRLGVIPTPGVAYLTVKLHADAGVVISASHNPFEHNGIKMFSGEGFKLSDALEEEIESLILREGELPVKTGAALGQVMDGAFTAEQYLDHLASTVGQLPRMRVLIDCANGAASATARKLFSRFALNVDYINDTPNGVNINNHCGSTHLEDLAQACNWVCRRRGWPNTADGGRRRAAGWRWRPPSRSICARKFASDLDLPSPWRSSRGANRGRA